MSAIYQFLLLLLIFWGRIIFAVSVAVIPDYSGYAYTMFPQDPLPEWGNTGPWGKLKIALQHYGHAIYGARLDDFSCHELDDLECLLIQNVPWYAGIENLKQFPKDKLYLIVYEPPAVEPFLHMKEYEENFFKILTWDDEKIDGKKFVKFHYPVRYSMIQNPVPFHQKSFLCLIARNKHSNYFDEIYSLRREAIEYFTAQECSFDLFGYGWEFEEIEAYQGSVEDKYSVLKKYRYSICFENTQNIQGYITEKIFDCFHVGCVPVYYGASNIEKYIPKECFIDFRDFNSFEELYTFLESISEEQYNEYIVAIARFLESEEAKVFSEECFVKTLCKELFNLEIAYDDLPN